MLPAAALHGLFHERQSEVVMEVPRDTSPLWRWHPHRGEAGLTRVMGARVLASRQSGIHRFRCSGVLIVIVIVIFSIIFVVASDHWNDHS